MSARPLIVVVTDRRDLPPAIPGLNVVEAEDYLAGGAGLDTRGATVINLCRNLRYLARGYYVSLLADARGQTPIPTIQTLEGLQHPHALFRALREAGVDVLEAHEMAARLREGDASGNPLQPDGSARPVVHDVDDDDEPFYRLALPDEQVDLLVCVGRAELPGFQRLAARVFRAWPAPLLRLKLVREDDRWKLYDLFPEKVTRLTEDERAALVRALKAPAPAEDRREERRVPSIAVLYDERDPFRASTPETVERLEKIANRRGLRVERIGSGDLHRLGEHDALFIRTVTGLDRPSFRFAVKAEALGLPVIDDPRSIIRCSNKIFLHELLSREGLPTPKTVVFDRSATFAELSAQLGSPYIVKLPDGSFSGAVFKVGRAEEHEARSADLLKRSPLLLAQAYTPSAFDWRVTVLDGRPLFVCRYYMAPGHWQIRQMTNTGARYGRVEAVARDDAPPEVVRVACRAARLVGDGMYGVDLKETPQGGVVVIEVNDNPNMDIGYDDAADGDVLFEDLVSWFEKRLARDRERPEARGKAKAAAGPMDALRKPVGRAPRRAAGRAYKAWEVLGLELEYPVVNRDLNAISAVEEALSALAGRPTSDVDLGLVGFSNEIFDHVLEIKSPVPLASLAQTEEVLVEGVRRISMVLAARLDARLLPGGMHPWFDPKNGRLWRRSNRRIYDTYSRLFDVHSHGWANVQASHVNLPMGSEAEAVAMMNAASALIPYLPAIAASSPMHDGELQDGVDNRLAFIIHHQARLPESSGQIVPEPVSSLASYKRDILGRMYQALDRLPEADAIRSEFLNARGAVFKFSRESMEVRVLDVQECVKMDVAIACFTRNGLRALAGEIGRGKLILPDHATLVSDFHAVVERGTEARVRAPHLALKAPRDADGRVAVRDVLNDVLGRARVREKAEDRAYLDLVERVIAAGSLSERIGAALRPYADDEDAFLSHARQIFRQLSECLLENRPWAGRGL